MWKFADIAYSINSRVFHEEVSIVIKTWRTKNVSTVAALKACWSTFALLKNQQLAKVPLICDGKITGSWINRTACARTIC